jgi:hypothetical protein
MLVNRETLLWTPCQGIGSADGCVSFASKGGFLTINGDNICMVCVTVVWSNGQTVKPADSTGCCRLLPPAIRTRCG